MEDRQSEHHRGREKKVWRKMRKQLRVKEKRIDSINNATEKY